MGQNYVSDPLAFLVDAILGLYIMVVVLRVMLQMTRADFYNPISQFIVKITDPLVKPLRRVIPGLFGLDLATILLAVALQMGTLGLVTVINGGSPALLPLLLVSLVQLVHLVLNIYLFSIIIIAVISWINPGNYNPAIGLLHSLTEPLLAPARRIIPPISGLDLSPLAVILLIQAFKIFLTGLIGF